MTVRVVCAVVFIVFSFLWLYAFQSDLLAYTQHVHSGGRTVYQPLVGAIFITAILWLLQAVVCRFVNSRGRAYALTFFPSLLLLGILTSTNPDSTSFVNSSWLWFLPLSLLVWSLALWGARSLRGLGVKKSVGLFSQRMWMNMLLMVVMMIGVAVLGNTNAVTHYTLRAESAMKEGNYDEALCVGKRSLETDGRLMTVRMYALSKKGLLGERLFAYPLVASSQYMLPTAGRIQMLFYPTDSVYRHLGAIPRQPMQPMEYLQAILRSRQAKPAVADYLLCGYLIDKNLDAFAREIGNYYTVNDSLPRHYREALVLYTHLRSNPVLVYHDAVLDVDYDDLRKMESACHLESQRRGKLLENYANSYWYYYDYVD